jgi:cation diffusion facilitator CzcD-associated flavoprotein CzcO
MPERDLEQLEAVIIGGGQAGLAVGHHLARRDRPFVILDAHQRVGDAWRSRWDSLRLFTPARYNALAGLPFPAPAHSFPTKDQVADYLESYAARFELPVRTGVRVDRLSRDDGRFVVVAGNRRWEADNVVVAMSSFQVPASPPSPPTSVPRSSSSIWPGTATLPSSKPAASWWSELATRARRSPWRSPAGTRPGWRARSQVMSRSGSRGRRPGTSSSPCCSESSATAC